MSRLWKLDVKHVLREVLRSLIVLNGQLRRRMLDWVATHPDVQLKIEIFTNGLAASAACGHALPPLLLNSQDADGLLSGRGSEVLVEWSKENSAVIKRGCNLHTPYRDGPEYALYVQRRFLEGACVDAQDAQLTFIILIDGVWADMSSPLSLSTAAWWLANGGGWLTDRHEGMVATCMMEWWQGG